MCTSLISRMNALKEITKMIEDTAGRKENRTAICHDTILKWLVDNKVLTVALEGKHLFTYVWMKQIISWFAYDDTTEKCRNKSSASLFQLGCITFDIPKYLFYCFINNCHLVLILDYVRSSYKYYGIK